MRGLVITARQMNWQTLWDLFVCCSGCTTCEAVLVLVEESLFLDLSLSKEKMPSSGQEEFLSGGILSALGGPYSGHCLLN
jgi:hypothetical protein